MSMLQSVLRHKHLRRTRLLQEISAAQVSYEASRQQVATSRRLHEHASAELWQALTMPELNIQRMSLARAQENMTQLALDEATRTHARSQAQLEDLRRALARLEKDIEKLQQRCQVRLSVALSQRLCREWNALDDWVAGRHGAP